MNKLKITAYRDEEFQHQIGKMELPILPENYVGKKGIEYVSGRELGANKRIPFFSGYRQEEFSLECLIDCTGAVPETKEEDTVPKRISTLEDLLYQYNGDSHQPNFIELAWGTLLVCCRLKEMEVNYTLFSGEGLPLRAKITLHFVEYVSRKTALKLADRQSPDMSHVIVFRKGDSIAALCQQIYGDSTLVDEVARLNGLAGFRRVEPGTTLLFPRKIAQNEF